jgi:hypothetical protein
VYIAIAVPPVRSPAWVVVPGFLFNEKSMLVFLRAVRLVEAALLLGNKVLQLVHLASAYSGAGGGLDLATCIVV